MSLWFTQHPFLDVRFVKRRRDQDTQKPGPQDVLIQKLTEENLQLKAQVEALTRELRNLKGSLT